MTPTIKTAIRTMTPFDGGLSPLTDKSKGVPLFGNTPLIQDLINGEKEGFDDIKGRGSWSSEEQEDKSFHEEGSEYRLDESLRKLDTERANGRASKIRWVAEMEDGSQYDFPNREVADIQLRIMGKPFRRVFKRVVAADTDVVARIIEGCAGVVSRGEDGQGGVGAAFCVAEGKFLTCAHVVKSYAIGEYYDDQEFMSQNVELELSRDGRSVPARMVAVSLRSDIALLEADLPSNVLVLADSKGYAAGEPVVVVGSPKGYENSVSEGIIGGLDRIVFCHDGAPKHVFTDAKILPGNSGGPMVSMVDGKVVGMVEIIVGEDAPYGLNAAIESEYLIDALKGMGVVVGK